MAAIRQFGLFGGAGKPRVEHRFSSPPKGYAATPGTGPMGETCGSCAHCRARSISRHRRVYKCGLMIAGWSSERSSDVLKKSPACAKWEAGTPRVTTIRTTKS